MNRDLLEELSVDATPNHLIQWSGIGSILNDWLKLSSQPLKIW